MKAAGAILLAAGLLCAGTTVAAVRHHAPLAHHHHLVHHHVSGSHLSVEMRDDSQISATPYASRTPSDDRLRPSIDTQVGRATASFGFHPGVVGRTLDPHELDGAAEPRLGHDESTAGATVKIPL